MEKLTIPEGCSFEGEITSISNDGDISINSTLTPLRLESRQGDIQYKTQSSAAACEEIRAEMGQIDIEAAALVVEKVTAKAGKFHVGELELDTANMAESLDITADELKLRSVKTNNFTFRGDTLRGDSLEVEGTLRLESNLSMVRHIRAAKVVVAGSIDCKHLEASEGVVVESGNVAIKKLDAPHFEAAPEVTGIVVVATCKDVKAQGVRGFLHPDELGMLSDAAGDSATSSAPTVPSPPPEPVAPPAAEPVVKSVPEPDPIEIEAPIEVAADNDIYSVDLDELPEPAETEEAVNPEDLDDGVLTAELDDVDFDTDEPEEIVEVQEQDALEDSALETLPDDDLQTRDVSEIEPNESEKRLPSGEFDTVALDPDALKQLTETELSNDNGELPEPGAFDMPETSSDDDHLSVDDTFGDTSPDSDPVSFDDEATAANDMLGEDTFGDEITADPEGGFDSLPDPDFDTPTPSESDDLADLSELSADDLPDDPVDDLDAEELGADDLDELSSTFEPEELAELDSVDLDSADLDEPSADDMDVVQGDFDPEDIADALPEDDMVGLDDDTPVADDDYDPSIVESVDDPLSDELEDEPHPDDVPSIYSEAIDDVLGNTGEEEPDGTFGEDDLANEVLEVEDEVDPEDAAIADLTDVMERIRAYFPEDNYPPYINQIMRYLEERRLKLFFKESNRNAVLSSFDKFNHAEISKLVRAFFERLDDYRKIIS